MPQVVSVECPHCGDVTDVLVPTGAVPMGVDVDAPDAEGKVLAECQNGGEFLVAFAREVEDPGDGGDPGSSG